MNAASRATGGATGGAHGGGNGVARADLAGALLMLFDRCPDGLFVFGAGGACVELNAAACSLAGGDRAGLLGLPAGVLFPGMEDVFAETARGLSCDPAVRAATLARRDGGRMAVTAEWFGDGSGLACCQVRRPTDDRQAADELLRATASLEERVAERTARLEEANRELEAFTYSISHDLRAPLRAIKGFACYLEEQHAANLDADGLRLLGVVRKNAYRMDRLITDLLNLSRVSREIPRAVPVDMEALARAAWAEAADPDTIATFRLELHPLPAAVGDPSLLRQVWLNLLSNAVKYSMKSAERSVEILGSADGSGLAAYTVRDRGAGFDPEYADKLFGVFQRLHDASEFEGTGVGLAVVQRIVSRHGGTVWAEGRPGEGAAFHFTIPGRR